MKVLSLFDGMSCGRIALERSGIKVNSYFASEIDKYAIKVAMANYPDTVQLGDVTKWREWDIDWGGIGLVMGGSPCQGFSFAGKQLAFDDSRSVLFFVFVEILEHVKKCNPDVLFLLENVKMKRDHEQIISKYMGVRPIEINSALVSAQNRVRLYWTNIGMESYGLFGDKRGAIKDPVDKGILLKDILEQEVDEKYYLSDKFLNGLQQRKGLNIKNTSDKANCFTAGGNSGGLHSDMTLIGCVKFGRTEEAKKIRKENLSKGKDYSPFSKKEITGIDFDKMNTLTTASNKDNLIFTKNYLQWDTSGKGYKSQQDRAFYEEGKHGSLCASRTDDKTGVIENGRIRRLTPVECERLQTVEDDYTAHVSDTQRYRMLGNGWTIDVICHILSYI